MAAPVTAATASGSQTTAVNIHPVTLPSGISAGDLLLVVLTTGDSGGGGGVPPVYLAGSDWQPLPVVARAFICQAAFWKVAAGSDTLTIFTSVTTHSSHISMRITGHGSAVQSATASGSSTNADPPSATLSGGAQDTLAIAVCGNVGTVVASAAPSGFTGLVTKAGDAAGESTSVANLALTATNTQDPGVFTTTTTSWVSRTLIVASTAITTKARTSQEVAESLSQVSPNLVMTQEVAESLSQINPNLVMTQQVIEALSSNLLNMVVSQMVAEMVSTNVPNDSRGGPVVQTCG